MTATTSELFWWAVLTSVVIIVPSSVLIAVSLIIGAGVNAFRSALGVGTRARRPRR